MEFWKFVETIHGARKQEFFESTRRDTFDSTYEAGRLEYVIEDGGDDVTNKSEKKLSKESESRSEFFYSIDKEKPQSKEKYKMRTSQKVSSASHMAPTRLGCGFRVDQMALNYVIQRTLSWQ